MKKKKYLIPFGMGLSVMLLGLAVIGNTYFKPHSDEGKQQQISVVEEAEQISDDSVITHVKSSADLFFDPTNIEEVYNQADLVVIGTVINKDSAIMTEDGIMAKTPGTLEVESVIKGEIEDSTISFNIPGGIVSVQEYYESIKDLYPEQAEKTGFSELSSKQRSAQYLSFDYEYSRDFEIGEKYIFMLNLSNDDLNNTTVRCYTGMIPFDESLSIQTEEDILNLPESYYLR